MKILILGNDGYIGFPLTLHLLKRGHEVYGMDNLSRRTRVDLVGSDSLTPIASASARKYYFTNAYDNYLGQDNKGTLGWSHHFIRAIL